MYNKGDTDHLIQTYIRVSSTNIGDHPKHLVITKLILYLIAMKKGAKI